MADRFYVLFADHDRDAWLELLRADERAEVFAHPGYLELFSKEGYRPFLAVYEEGEKRLLYPGILRDIRMEPWARDQSAAFDVIPPPFGYSGPFPVAAHAPDTECRFFARYAEWARQTGVIAEYATCAPHRDSFWGFPGEISERMPTVVRDLVGSPESIALDYKGSVRTDIKSALRQGVTVEEEASGERIPAFLRVYDDTMDARGAAESYRMNRAFLTRLVSALPGCFRFFHAHQAGQIVSTELVLVSADSTFFFRGGTLRDSLKTRANLLLKDAVIRWSLAAGKRWYLLGGGNSGDDPLFKYKRAFAPRGVRMLRVGRWTLDPERSAQLLEARRKHHAVEGRSWAPQPGFFPEYRSPGQVAS